MNDWYYIKEGGQFQLVDGLGNKIAKPTERLAFYVDADDECPVLLRHGNIEKITLYSRRKKKEFLICNIPPQITGDIIVIDVTPMPLDDINKCLSNERYINEFLNKATGRCNIVL